jgi:malonyl CoA-acyl carrier protein transacylase
MKTYMFPGQGSQARGMGGNLFDEFPEMTGRADEILGYSIKELCLSDPRRELGKTQFTQPALYVANALAYYKRLRETGETPDFVAGHSLGELSALHAAGCFDFETGLKLVAKRGELMSEATDGAMAAVVNVPRERIEAVLKQNGLDQVDVANLNAPGQVVISGPAADIAACQNVFRSDNATCIPLNTSGAFHSRLMIPSQERFERHLKSQRISDPKIPVIANLTARPYPQGRVVEYLSKQIRSTVLWSDSIAYLMSLSRTMEFVEIGHGDVLTKLVARIRQHAVKAESATSIPAAAEAVDVRRDAEPGAKSEAPTGRAAAAATCSDRVALAERQVAAWNTRHRVGTRARSRAADHGDLITRTPAMVVLGRRAAVYMEGYKGYFDLDEIAAV